MTLKSAANLAVFYVVFVVVVVVIVIIVVLIIIDIAEFAAEETNGFVFGGWRGAEEGELREGVDFHEVVGFSVVGVVVHEEEEEEGVCVGKKRVRKLEDNEL